MTSAAQRHRAYAAWLTISIVWGTTYLAIKVALETIPPFLMGGMRYLTAGGALLLFMAARGRPMPGVGAWKVAFVSGALLLGLGNGGVAWAELYVPTGLTAVLVAATPFWMVGVDRAFFGGERLTRQTFIGLATGFTGIVWLVWPQFRAAFAIGATSWGFVLGVLALQVAEFGWALGSAYSRRHASGGDSLGAAAAQMVCGGAVMLAAGLLFGEGAALSFTSRTVAALFYLVVMGSLVGFVCYVYALHHLPTSIVSLYAYINPIVAVALGAAVLGENVGWRVIFAIATILCGTAIVSWKRPSA